MNKSEHHLLCQCMETLIEVQNSLKNITLERLIKKVDTAKDDSLFLDTFPELTLKNRLTQEYDKGIVLITEEKGVFNHTALKDAEIVIFADPTDRSKHLKGFIEYQLQYKQSEPHDILGKIFGQSLEAEWKTFTNDEKYFTNAPPDISAPCCSITVVKKSLVIFSIILNYITENISVACKDYIKLFPIKGIWEPQNNAFITGWEQKGQDIIFDKRAAANGYVTFLGKEYKQYLEEANIFNNTSFVTKEDSPGGPLRILYLSSLNNQKEISFVMANGEKIAEWIGWLAFCNFSGAHLRAYSIYPGTSFAKDDILMSPSPAYSILEISNNNELLLNFDKLKYYPNPSRYREMIIVTHKDNCKVFKMLITPLIEANKARQLI